MGGIKSDTSEIKREDIKANAEKGIKGKIVTMIVTMAITLIITVLAGVIVAYFQGWIK